MNEFFVFLSSKFMITLLHQMELPLTMILLMDCSVLLKQVEGEIVAPDDIFNIPAMST
jgi:hypothetical protein